LLAGCSWVAGRGSRFAGRGSRVAGRGSWVAGRGSRRVAGRDGSRVTTGRWLRVAGRTTQAKVSCVTGAVRGE